MGFKLDKMRRSAAALEHNRRRVPIYVRTLAFGGPPGGAPSFQQICASVAQYGWGGKGGVPRGLITRNGQDRDESGWTYEHNGIIYEWDQSLQDINMYIEATARRAPSTSEIKFMLDAAKGWVEGHIQPPFIDEPFSRPQHDG